MKSMTFVLLAVFVIVACAIIVPIAVVYSEQPQIDDNGDRIACFPLIGKIYVKLTSYSIESIELIIYTDRLQSNVQYFLN